MIFPVEVLVVICVLVGLFPNVMVGRLLDAAAASVLQGPLPYHDIKLWHGFNLPLLMSVIALAGGFAMYARRAPLFASFDRRLRSIDGKRIVDNRFSLVYGASRWLTARLENGSLQTYVFWLVAAAFAALMTGVAVEPLIGSSGLSPVDPASAIGTVALALVTLAAAVWHRRRLFALLMAGVVGLLVTLAFVRFSAPDLAMTQLLVEVVTILLLLLAMYFLPAETPLESSRGRRLRDVVLAGVGGLTAGAVTLALLTRPHESISTFYLEQAKKAAGGYNVVNVILVDFRGFDTLGEIVVLGIAALGTLALLHGMVARVRDRDWQGRPWAPDRHPVMLVVVSRPLLPLALLISLYLLLRGHNAPGGGFIAGLVTGVAIVLQYVASGAEWTRARLGRDHRWLIGAGLLIAIGTGLAPWAFGEPFLKSAFRYVELPVVGTVEIASAMLFDVGVFLTVVATVLIILATLGKLGPAERDPELELRE
jgi:multicomponent K+:H+ antiporter subunit A